MTELNQLPYHRFTKPRSPISFMIDGRINSFALEKHGLLPERAARKMMRKNHRCRMSLADFFNPP